ncbi:MAG: uroporphyrinogen decarboxylase family protein [candidate division KSB1 bacterium]|nr:uroporphyrinogen decarboxylase family protein [candidate division KSB1 bacterium]
MTHRQRMIAAFNFEHPDKIPVVYHPSPAGLHTHGVKLLDLFRAYPPDNPITFDGIPVPSEGAVKPDGSYREIKKDEWGTVWKHNIFGVHGHPIEYPFKNWKQAQDYEFPPFEHLINSEDILKQRNDFLVFEGWISLFEKLCSLRPMDDVLIGLYTRDADLLAFLDRMVEYWSSMIERLIEADVDVIVFGDDWGTQSSTIISPELFREIYKPRYATLMKPVKSAGKRIFFHSCGYLGHVLDDLLDLGINGLWPQIGQMENREDFLDLCVKNKLLIYIHPDRQQLIPRGTPDEIDSAIRNYAKRYHDIGGGAVFYIEIENDAPFKNVEALVKAVHRYR